MPGCCQSAMSCRVGRGSVTSSVTGRRRRYYRTNDRPSRPGRLLRRGRAAPPSGAARQAAGGGRQPAARGVVSTASYEARKYGIRSAMSCAEALRRCPHVVFVRPDHRTYREWSRRVWEIVRSMAPVVEQVGIDEGYLVLADGDPREQAALVQQAIRAAGAAVVLAGRGDLQGGGQDRVGHAQAGRHHVRPGGEEAAFLAPLAVRKLPGVGPEGRAPPDGGRDRDDRRAGGARRRPPARSCCPARLGAELRDRARGIDPRPVSAEPGEAISISSEETFERDITDRDELHAGCGRWPTSWPHARPQRPGGAHRHDQAALPGLLDRHPLAVAGGRHRRAPDDRRSGLPAARPRARPAAGRAAPGRRRRVRSRAPQAARAAGGRGGYAATGRRSSRC